LSRAPCLSRLPPCLPPRRRLPVASVALLALLAILLVVDARAGWVGEAMDLMGTRVSAELWADDESAGRALVERVMQEYSRIDAVMSTYKPTSEISRVNELAPIEPVAIGAELFDLISRSLSLSVASGGAFDITYESVGYLYDFRARRRPSDADIDRLLHAVGYRHVVLDPKAGTVRFTTPGVRINLGGIAKGYAVERAAAILREAGVKHALLNAGGDTRVVGDRRGQPWMVGIRHPRADGEIVTRLPIVDEAISTSGDYERFFEEAGRRYHHIINPPTGRSVQGMLSVTVIGPDATLTDGLSTALFVLGADEGLKLIAETAGYEAVFVDTAGRLSYSSGLTPPAE
jgi:thiamine biosynthesis lipoprotein